MSLLYFSTFAQYIFKILPIESLTEQLHRYILESWKGITANATMTDGVTDETNCRYILESWKRITTNATDIVNAPMELQMVFCR